MSERTDRRLRRPVVYVIAGPNGAGKTTFAMKFLPRISEANFINADLIAAGVSPLDPAAAAVEAGRIFLARIRDLMARRMDFAFETTLAGRGYVGLFDEMRAAGYRIHLFFLWLPSVALARKRVSDRVRKGGHDIPAATINRRFARGVHNLFHLYRDRCDTLIIYDNSTADPRLVATLSGFRATVVEPTLFHRIEDAASEDI